MTEKKRVGLPSHLGTRDSTTTHDGQLKNFYEEDTPIGKMIIKRPGQTNNIALGPCVAQGSTFFNGQPYFVCDNTLYTDQSTPPSVCASGTTPASYAEGLSADLDPITGYLWLNASTGHAYLSGGNWVIDTGQPAKKQIQVWDPRSKTLKFAIDSAAGGSDFIDGKILYASIQGATYMFVGRGEPGVFNAQYQAGYTYNTSTNAEIQARVINTTTDFNQGFYWPAIPSILNGNLYLVGSNGISNGIGLEFVPPATSPAASTWHDIPQPNNSVVYPDQARESFYIPNVGTLVQGKANQVSWSTSGTIAINNYQLPGANELISPGIYDPRSHRFWFFADTTLNKLYYLTDLNAAGTLVNANYTIPNRTVVHGAFDYGHNALRLITQRTSDNRLLVTLFDPNSQTILSEVDKGIASPNFGTTYRKSWNIEQCQRIVLSAGSGLYDIPYGS